MASSRVEILNDGGLRTDNRRPHDLRSMTFLLPSPASSASSSQPQPDGIATVTSGLTTVTASVFGPREPSSGGQGSSKGKEKAELSVEVGVSGWAAAGGRSRGRSDKKLLEIGAQIRQTFEPVIMTHLYPRSEIQVYIQVVGSDGGILPTAVNATTLALIVAGISMTDYCTSLSLGLHLSQPLLDLSSLEESEIPFLVLACLPTTKGITLATMESRIHVDRFEEMVRLGVSACEVIKEEMVKVIRKKTGKVVERMKVGVIGGGEGGESDRRLGMIDDVDMD